MARVAVLLAVVVAASNAALAQKMTYEEAKSRLPKRSLPAFWVGDVKDFGERLEKLARGEVRVIAKSPGGRPLYLVCYGRLEKVEHHANFNSAIGGRDPSAYMNKAARKKPVIYFVGPVHGQEVEGLTGLMNLIEVLETGRDRRGKQQPELRHLAEQCRLLIVPAGNPDGIARFEPRSVHGMPLDEFQFWGMGTWADGRIAFWPDSPSVSTPFWITAVCRTASPSRPEPTTSAGRSRSTWSVPCITPAEQPRLRSSARMESPAISTAK